MGASVLVGCLVVRLAIDGLLLKQLIEKLTDYNIPSYVALVDFSKAFDSLEWPILWRALSLQGVHQDLITLLQNDYESPFPPSGFMLRSYRIRV